MNNPTIVSAALSDKELQDSIDKMVANFDRGLQTMLEHSNEYVGKIQKSLQEIGNTNFGAKGSNDGGVAKQTKAQEEFTESVKRSTNEIKKHGKESEMTFDQIANALSQARRTVSDFNTKRASGILPSSDDYKRYEQALARIVEYNDKLKVSALGMADANQKWFGKFSSKRIDEMFFPKDSGQLAAMNKYYADLEKNSQQAAQSAQRYTEEIRRQAQAIRESPQWKTTGTYSYQIGDETYYVSKKQGEIEAQLVRHKEQQVNYEKEYLTAGMAVEQSTKQQSANEEKLVQAEQQRLGIEQQITQEKEKQKKRYISPEVEITPVSISSLRGVVAQKLSLSEKDVVSSNTASSIKTINAELKQLQDTYQKMTVFERESPWGDFLKRRFQELQRDAQKAQQQLSRPINLKDALGGSEKTLDNIAYKMQRLRSYKQGIDLTKPNAANEIKQVDEALARLQKDADKWMSKSQDMIKNNTALGRSWNYMKNRLAFYFTVGASTQFVKNLIEVRSQYEMNERALGILINSAERGTQIFNELSQMALVSPYTLIELSTAAKQLTAYDVAAKDVVDTTRRLADMASAVGIPIERLTYALGQIKAYGYLNSRDARMFANAGIPLVKQLSEYYTELEGRLVSTADVYDRIKKKSIDYSDVMQVINHMTDEGGKFFDFQAKMADTLKVRLANLTLAWNNMLNDMGKESQGVLTWGIGALRELFLQWRTFDKTLKEAAGAFGLYKAIQLIILGLQTATKSTLGLNARLTATGVLGTRLVTLFKALGGAMKSLAANWWLILVAAAVELSSAIINANEATKEFNKSMREGAESTANDLKKYIEQYKDLRDSLYKTQTQNLPNGKTKSTLVPQDVDKNEASKAWEAMREQIELSSAASNDFVSRLLQIENVSDRLREGFKIIDDIQQVNAALKDMGDEALVVTQKWSAWWNAWQAPDGLFTNLKEFKVELDGIRQKYGDIANARYVAEHGDTNRAANEQDAIMRAASEAVNDYDREMNRFRVDLDKYTSSLDNFANAMEFSSNPTQVAELYAKAVKQLVTQGQLNPQEAFDLQLQIEEARTNAMKLALQSRIADEESALKLAQDERTKESLNASIESNKAQLKLFENSTYEQTAYWNDFTKYIKERHISELTAAYNAMTENGKKEMDFQSVEWQNYVHKWANSYEKSHNLATDSVFNRIKNWINDANTWSIFIKMTISTEDKKSVYKELGEWDKAADDAYKTMQRLDKEISRLRKKGAKEVGVMLENNASADDKKLTQAIEERTQAQKDYNEAVANGGESKKKDAAGSKAQKAAESELAKALKDELSTIDKVRSIYKDLTKEGMSHADAVERATRGWGETVNAINRVLQKNGLQKLDLSKFAGIENPRELLNILQSQLETLVKRGASASEIKVIQEKIRTLEVDADKYDLTKITKGLNNELGKLKDEYELAVELDADPEMGSLFADWLQIPIESLPHTAKEYASRLTDNVNKYLEAKKSGIKIDDLLGLTNDDLRWFQKRVDSGELNQDWVDVIVKNAKVARDALKKENSDIAKEWNSLVQKYAEYEYKIAQVQRNANKERRAFALKYGTQEQKERVLALTTEIDAEKDQEKKQELIRQLKQLLDEITGNDAARLKIKVAIDNKELEEGARVAFEEFQKSPEWITATGDLAGMTDKALGMLIKDLEEYKKSASNLSPKQIKELNRALSNLYKQQREGNPFKFIANAMDNARERASAYDQKIADVSNKINDLNQKQVKNGKLTEEEKKAMDKLSAALADLFRKRKQVAKLSGKEIVDGLQAMFNWASQCVGMFNQMADALVGDKWSEAKEVLNDTMNTIQSGLQGAQLGAQVGGAWGAAIGGAAGLVMGAISSFFDNADKEIVEKIKDSEREVKKLENSYKNLEYAIEQAYGMAEYGARRAAIANRQLQLVELQRQLRLEQSRDSKHRDEERILELKGQIIDLRNEISQSVDDITNDLLGISSVGDAAEQLVSSMIDAFRQGEDYMQQYDESFEKMIDNMIMKAIVSRVVGDRIEQMWNQVKSVSEARGAEDRKRVEELTKQLSEAQDRAMAAQSQYDETQDGWWYKGFEYIRKRELDAANAELERIKSELAKAEKDYAKAIEPTKEDIDSMREMADGWREGVKNEFEYWMGAFGIGYGQDAESKQLSSLQQGIQSVTEETAGALEAITNGISQQCYLQSDILIQIRDTVQSFDIDVQTASLSQILLQLQTNYIVMQSMQSMMEGWTTPSGQGIRVELIS